MVIPCLIFIGEFTRPFTLTPGIADPNQFYAIDLFDLLDAIGVVEEDAAVANTVLRVTIVILDCVGASQ
jgi:hypothetical protein